MKNETRWKFLRDGLVSEHGNCKWQINKWKRTTKKLEMCECGFHCSKEIYQAFSYVYGEVLALVEVKGDHQSQDDKDVWSEMKVVRAWKWQKKDSVALSIFAAELCLENFEKVFPDDKRPREAIEAAKRWLKKPTKKNEAAVRSAESAAIVAARAAMVAAGSEESAAGSAAWSARAAAMSARSAAELAAMVAARAAGSVKKEIVKKIAKWMEDHIVALEELK